MKKHFSQMLLALMLMGALLMTACRKAETVKTEGADAEQISETASEEEQEPEQELSMFSYFSPSMTRKQSIIYFLDSSCVSQRICYYDPATGTSSPLCGKPECTHQEASCNAFTGAPEYTILVDSDDEYIWWICYEKFGAPLYLWRSDADGKNRLKVLKLAEYAESDSFPRGKTYAQIREGRLIVGGFNYIVKDAEEAYRYHIDSYDLESGDCTAVYDSGQTNKPRDLIMQCYQGKVYYCLTEYAKDEDRGKIEFMENDIAGGHEKRLYTSAWDIELNPSQISVFDNRLYFCSPNPETGTHLYELQIDSGELKECFTLSTTSGILARTVYAGYEPSEEGHFRLVLTDLSGNTLSDRTYPYAHEGTIPMLYSSGADEENIYMRFEWGSDLETEILAIPYDGSDQKTIWQEKWLTEMDGQ